MSWINDNFISRFFVTIIEFFYSITGNYLLAVVLFTVVIKLLMLPLDLRQRRATAQQGAVSAKTKEIQNRYKHDPRLAQQKVNEFYKKENIKPSAGCLPLLLQMPIMFAMFGAITLLSNSQGVKLVLGLADGSIAMPPSAMWVHNIWRPDSGGVTVMPSAVEFSQTVISMAGRMPAELLTNAQLLVNNAQINQMVLTTAKLAPTSFFSGMISTSLATVPTDVVTQAIGHNYVTAIAPVTAAFDGMANGMFIFPAIAAILTFLSSYIPKKQAQRANPDAPPQPGAGGGMEYIMPVITLVWTSTSGVCFALYWMASSVITIATSPILNRVVRTEKPALPDGRK